MKCLQQTSFKGFLLTLKVSGVDEILRGTAPQSPDNKLSFLDTLSNQLSAGQDSTFFVKMS
jgi:hypothetical protein